MHYVSWDRANRDEPKLLAEDGPEVLGIFEHDRAIVSGQHWELTSSPDAGAVATCGGREVERTNQRLSRAKRIDVAVADPEGRVLSRLTMVRPPPQPVTVTP